MTYFVARYDFRCPTGNATPRHELYAAALDQAAYCEASGFDSLVLSEHHGTADGYLPSPLIAAAAMTARTSTIPITVAALLARLHDPLRLAEDIAVLDHLSRGRVTYVFGLGYRRAEYEMFDRDWSTRGEDLETAIRTILTAWQGEPFEHDGRTVTVTPTPFSQPHPFLFYGGGSTATARRAARLGLGFYPQSPDPELARVYREESEAQGRRPGLVMQPPAGPANVFCAEEPEEFWDRYGPHLLADATSYAEWQSDTTSLVRDASSSIDEMRDAGVYVVWTPDELVERCRSGEVGLVTANPLCGGLPPEAGGESLRLLGDVVIPALRSH